ncbi:transcription activator MSS11-like [Schistocerca piceifrons]|uniref:transcription activator MSS11-like n=1 Tax=Schistocerca piceifrons TaxID=274613 RepID=UPI001F5E990C|nr:transcription activator MSS11-like [Schistocerca piceifrons]
MDTEEQQLVSAGNVELGTSSSTSTLFEDITCENVGAGAQEVVPPPISPQGDVEKEVVPPPEKQEPESGNLPGGYSLQAILERVLNYQAEFAQQQVERDRQQAERDRRLAENLLAQQAERDRQLTESFLAQQAERDRRQAERDQQLVQSLENMKKEFADMKQNYESIPKAVQELTEQVNNLQVANTSRVDEIGVLANRVEKLEIDSTQLVEQKWNEQATKIETEFNSWLEVKECEIDKNINSKVQAAIANRGSESFSTAVNSQVRYVGQGTTPRIQLSESHLTNPTGSSLNSQQQQQQQQESCQITTTQLPQGLPSNHNNNNNNKRVVRAPPQTPKGSSLNSQQQQQQQQSCQSTTAQLPQCLPSTHNNNNKRVVRAPPHNSRGVFLQLTTTRELSEHHRTTHTLSSLNSPQQQESCQSADTTHTASRKSLEPI